MKSCCHTSGSLLADADLPEPARPIAKATARLSTKAIMPPTLRQCATTVITAITAMRAASVMFAMRAMLSRLVAQLKMPRLDAYKG